nr:hypothetical protein [Actinomycetales bacterium]
QQAEHAEALRYAIRSGDWDFAAHISERSSLGVILTPDHRDLGAMLADIPDDEVVSRPNLLVARAWARFDEEKYDRAIAKLNHAEWSIAAHPERERQETVVSLHLLSALISRVRGDAAGTVAAASRTLEAIRGLDDGLQQEASLLTDIAARLRAIGELWQGQPERLLAMRDWSGLHAQVSTSLDFFGSAWEGLTALAEVAQGRLENARRRAMRALSEHKRIGAEVQESPRIGPWSDTGRTAHAWLALGLVAAHQADVDTMDECLTLGRAANTHANPFLTAGFLLLTAHRRLARGDIPGTRAALAELRTNLLAGYPVPWLSDMGAAVAVRAELLAGLPERARAVLDLHERPSGIGAGGSGALAGSPLAGPPHIEWQNDLLLARARVLLATNRHHEVRNTVQPLLHSLGSWRAEAWLMVALAEDALRHESVALEALAHSLDAAASERLQRPFLPVGPWLAALLQRHDERTGTHREMVARLLGDITVLEAELPVEREPLTERERAVLALLPTMSTNSEIADALHISVNTVKQHLKSIHRKLQVTSRRDAFRMAQHLDLLPRGVSTEWEDRAWP